MRVPIGVVKEGERSSEYWILLSGSSGAETEFLTNPVSADSDNNTYASGTYNNLSGMLVKYDKFGDILFASTTRQPDVNQEQGLGTICDSSNNLYRVSNSFRQNPAPPTSIDYFTKYNSSLQMQFQRQIITSSPLLYFGGITGITLDSSSNIIVFGEIVPDTNSTTDQQAYLAKFNPSGTLIWQRRFGDNRPISDLGFLEIYFAIGVVTDSSNNIYFLSGSNFSNSSGLATAVLLKYDASGNFQWKKRFDSPEASESVFPSGIGIDSQDNIFVSMSGSAAVARGFLLKLNTSGEIQWQRLFPDGGLGSIFVTDSSDIYVTGGGAGNVFKINSSAEIQWQFSLQEPPSPFDSLTVAVGQNETVYINALRFGSVSPNQNYVRAAIPSDGSLYGSYSVGPITIVLSKAQTALTASSLFETTISTTSATASATVQTPASQQVVNIAFTNYKVIL